MVNILLIYLVISYRNIYLKLMILSIFFYVIENLFNIK